MSTIAADPIAAAVRSAFVRLEALDRRALASVDPHLTPAQYRTLSILAGEPEQSLSALAHRLLCDKANASGLVRRLEVLGLVERAEHPEDGRSIALRLTAAGYDAWRAAAAACRSALDSALTGYDRPAISRTLDDLNAALDTALTQSDRSLP